jgi:hypothetical protein
LNDIAAAAADVRGYIATEIRSLLDEPNFIEALGGFLLPDAASQGGACSSRAAFDRCPFTDFRNC